MGLGTFVLMLHSHLPYYRKAGMWPFGEENLYECMLETYLPLLNMLNELVDEGIKPRITIGITPILAEQLADEEMKQGFISYVQRLAKVARDDQERFSNPKVEHGKHLAFLAQFYQNHFESTLHDFSQKYNRDLLSAFKALQDAGAIEITTSSATHGFSPLLKNEESINAQFKIGVESYKRHFGRKPRGYWLPECAYRPAPDVSPNPLSTSELSTDAYLFENGLDYFFTEYHAIEGSIPTEARRAQGIYNTVEYIPLSPRPVTGLTTFEAYTMRDFPVAVMGRSNRASFQVWSAAHGYPGDGLYREFHKKDEISGLHYWRLTSKETAIGDKTFYDPVQAFSHVESQAHHFADLCQEILKEQHKSTDRQGLLMVSFDTELYGHWWYEGVAWLKAVLKRLHAMDTIDVETASDYLVNHPPSQAIELPESTWGQGGHYWVWSNENTEWMWPIIHQTEDRFAQCVRDFGGTPNELQRRILNQAFREMLLLQSSDWPFLVTTFQAKEYAIERFEDHTSNFHRLCDMLKTGNTNVSQLSQLEMKNNPFPNLDYHWYTLPQKAHQAIEATKKEAETLS